MCHIIELDATCWRAVRTATAESGSSVPVDEAPEWSAERAEVEAAQRISGGEHRMPDDHRNDHDVLHYEIVHPDEHRRSLHGIHLAFRRAPEAIVFVVAPARHVDAGPLVRLLRRLPRAEGAHERLR